MERSPSGQAFTELVLEVFRLNGRLLGAGDSLTGLLGQTSARWQVLGALDDERRTVAEIGRQMGLTRQSVQRTADILEADGLVSYVDNPAHQRAKLAMLTRRGRATLDAITSRQIAWANAVGGRLEEDDVRHAIRTMQQVRDALDLTERGARDTRARPTRPASPRVRRRSRR
jgi:DNA-binding MarR family transcriptional regulator